MVVYVVVVYVTARLDVFVTPTVAVVVVLELLIPNESITPPEA